MTGMSCVLKNDEGSGQTTLDQFNFLWMSRPPLAEGFMPEKIVMCRTIGTDEMLTENIIPQNIDFASDDELSGIQMEFSQSQPSVYHLTKMAFKFENSNQNYDVFVG